MSWSEGANPALICPYPFASICPRANQDLLVRLNPQPCGKKLVPKEDRLVGNYIIVLCKRLGCFHLADKWGAVSAVCDAQDLMQLLVLTSEIKKWIIISG